LRLAIPKNLLADPGGSFRSAALSFRHMARAFAQRRRFAGILDEIQQRWT
jgi:hypothetical protein